jgi:hypothetical protein
MQTLVVTPKRDQTMTKLNKTMKINNTITIVELSREEMFEEIRNVKIVRGFETHINDLISKVEYDYRLNSEKSKNNIFFRLFSNYQTTSSEAEKILSMAKTLNQVKQELIGLGLQTRENEYITKYFNLREKCINYLNQNIGHEYI